MCVWSYEENAKRMEYVATETRTPDGATRNGGRPHPPSKLVVCSGGYVMAHFSDRSGAGDFNLLRLNDPLHGGYTLDWFDMRDRQ